MEDFDKKVIYSEEFSKQVSHRAIDHAVKLIDGLQNKSEEIDNYLQQRHDDQEEQNKATEDLILFVADYFMSFLDQIREEEEEFFKKRGLDYDEIIQEISKRYNKPEEIVDWLDMQAEMGKQQLNEKDKGFEG